MKYLFNEKRIQRGKPYYIKADEICFGGLIYQEAFEGWVICKDIMHVDSLPYDYISFISIDKTLTFSTKAFHEGKVKIYRDAYETYDDKNQRLFIKYVLEPKTDYKSALASIDEPMAVRKLMEERKCLEEGDNNE